MDGVAKNTKAPLQRSQSTCQKQQPKNDNTSNSAEAQRLRILSRLTTGPANTIELRKELDCLMPAARVHELRHNFGYDIITIWVAQQTECGKLHRVAQYTLKSEKGGNHG